MMFLAVAALLCFAGALLLLDRDVRAQRRDLAQLRDDVATSVALHNSGLGKALKRNVR